ncbi:ABC transporter permease [Chloroflexota bacterium]
MMQSYIIKRLLWIIPIMLGAVTVIFLIMNVLPGDVAMVILGEEGASVSPEKLEVLRQDLGLNRPLYEQYFSWMGGLLHGDLGTSLWTGLPVTTMIAVRLPYSLTLVAMAVLISIIIAIPVGVIAALKQDSWVDYLLRVFAIAGLSMPSFWFAILILLFVVSLFKWFPPLAYAPIYEDPFVALQQLFLPAIAIGYRQAAVSARMMRSSMLEVLREDYIRTAWAKGLRERTVIYLHALKNAGLPVITIFGVEIAVLFSSQVIIEGLFNIPGIGGMLVEAILHRDIPLAEGTVLFIVVFVMLVNLMIDIIYSWVDPRVTYK